MCRADEPSPDEGALGDSAVRTFLSWPPPGLEAAQGKLWPPIAVVAIADLTLILPLLWSAGATQDLWSFGPFGNNWWIPLLTTGVGIVLLLYGLARLGGLFRLAAKATSQGHGWLMVLRVAADFQRDTGFLLQGARLYAGTQPSKRSLMATARIVSAVALIVAALWVPLGFVVSIMSGARGLIGAAGVWYVTIAPACLLVLVGVLSRLLGATLSRQNRKDSGLRAAVDEEIRSQVSRWNEQSAPLRRELGLDPAMQMTGKPFRVGALGLVLLAALVLVPVTTVTMTGAVGTVLAAIAVPSFDHAQARVAVAEVLRRYRLEPDESVTPEQAGIALHALLSASLHERERILEREPERAYPDPWFPEDGDAIVGGSPGDWALGLFDRSARGMSTEERAYLTSVAAHPAHAEFRIVATADSVDVLGTRFVLPFPDTVTPFELPIPHFAGIRNGANGHVALAATELHRGRPDRAEEVLRELLSVGFVLIDEGPTIIDAMIGTRLVDTGAEALERLYRATRRSDEAETLMWVRNGMEGALERAAVSRSGFDAEGALRMMREAVLNEEVVRGLRWEYFLTFSTLAPCVNLNKVVFGPGQNYDQWLADAEHALVRRQSDEMMFRFMQQGWFRDGKGLEAPFWMRTALRITFGGSLGGTCAAQLGGLDMVGVVQ